jgi:hypothetical protein
MLTKIEPLTKPLIHLNGNSGENLLEQYQDASEALSLALEKFLSIQFHPRDYYPLPEGSWDKALSERNRVLRKFADIEQYLNAISEDIYKQLQK